MDCFYHPGTHAVGICKYCGRGVCVEDAAMIEDTLACRDRHEEKVRGFILMESRGILNARRMAAGFLRNAIFYGLVGFLFSGFGYYQIRWLGLQGLFLLLIGVFLLYAAAANYFEYRKYQ